MNTIVYLGLTAVVAVASLAKLVVGLARWIGRIGRMAVAR
jgi:hypothetical protein